MSFYLINLTFSELFSRLASLPACHFESIQNDVRAKVWPIIECDIEKLLLLPFLLSCCCDENVNIRKYFLKRQKSFTCFVITLMMIESPLLALL